MRIVEVPVRVVLPPPKDIRSVGVHQSAIIRCLATESGILAPEWAEELSLVDARVITDQTAILRMMIGLAWEQLYIPTIPEINHQPGELEVDGVYMTPDGESISVIITLDGRQQYALVVHECKATYKSVNTVANLDPFHKGNWMWLAQIKGYCKGKNTRFSSMHVLFINGDYTYPLKPMLKRWDIEFTQDEIDTNWQQLMEYRDGLQMRLELQDGILTT